MSIRLRLACFLFTVVLCISGCTPHSDPMAGWTMLGTLDELPASVSVPDTIKQDMRAYIQTLPPDEKRTAETGGIWLSYHEDGTGQHAVVIWTPHDGEHWHHALIYDRDNHRIKVLKYSTNGYMS